MSAVDNRRRPPSVLPIVAGRPSPAPLPRWQDAAMRSHAVVDATLADALPNAVEAVADQTPPGWRFAFGPPPPAMRKRMAARYPAQLWWAWRQGGWFGPPGLFVGIGICFIVLFAVFPTPSLVGAAVAVLTVTLVCVPLSVGLGWAVLRWRRQWQLARPGRQQILWGHDADRWAVLLLRQRPDGSWSGCDFVSTRDGCGRYLVRLGTAIADDRAVTIHLSARGRRLVAYYQAFGFTPDPSTRPRLLTRMTYIPRSRRTPPHG